MRRVKFINELHNEEYIKNVIFDPDSRNFERIETIEKAIGTAMSRSYINDIEVIKIENATISNDAERYFPRNDIECSLITIYDEEAINDSYDLIHEESKDIVMFSTQEECAQYIEGNYYINPKKDIKLNAVARISPHKIDCFWILED